MICKNKSFINKRAFTLIELLIVIAIIGILFIVLVSKVDFATDKAKATGVQTDFRSFQLAFETVSRENAGFNTFGWDTGDANQDGIRNSYDEGDANKDGIQNGAEVFTGHKVYDETFTKVYSLKKNGTGSYDRDALNRLETAINANLDPKLHITIKDDGEIVMANGAQDPWNKEYHGYYITNAEVDKKDRGAIVMYSDGANNEFGSEHSIANGIVTISIPGNNKAGKDDYGMVVVYTYVNGYGEIKTSTSGFSNNQGGEQSGTDGTFTPGSGGSDETPDNDVTTRNIIPEGGTYYVNAARYSNSINYSYDVDEIYYAGDYFPEPQVGDIYVYGDYAYGYKWCVEQFNYNLFWSSCFTTEDSHWGVCVYDENKGNYGEILSYINGLPVTDMPYTFYVNDSVESITVPGTVINTLGTFASYNASVGAAKNLKTVYVSEGVTDIGRSFCSTRRNLTAVYLPSTIKVFSCINPGVYSYILTPALIKYG